MRQMLTVPEYDVSRNRGRVDDHSQQVAVHAEILAVDGGLRCHPYAAVIEHPDVCAQGHWCGGGLHGEPGAQVDGVSCGVGAGDDDAELGKPLDIEEVRGPEVVIPLVVLGVDCRRLDIDSAEYRL